jgi:phosphatidylglycerol:prolipoprotein diacylglycerol transferase
VVSFNFFGLEIRYYGIVLALSMLFALLVAYVISKKYYKDTNPAILLDVFPFLIFSGVIGARLYYVILNFQYYLNNPAEILMLRNGGLSIHGALLGGLIGGVIYCKIKKIPVLKYADILSFGIVLAQALGRWGNFFNSEAFGYPTKLPLLYIAPKFRPVEYFAYDYFHPTFLYESILDVLIFLILFFLVRKIARKDGTIFFSYLILYSLARFFVENLRIDSVLNIFGVPIAQVVSILIISICTIALFILYYDKKQI